MKKVMTVASMIMLSVFISNGWAYSCAMGPAGATGYICESTVWTLVSGATNSTDIIEAQDSDCTQQGDLVMYTVGSNNACFKIEDFEFPVPLGTKIN